MALGQPMRPERLEEILQRASRKRFLVIGDLMVDKFIKGKVGRISPEAPVPVVEVTDMSYYPGGAANVARNIREFGGHVSVAGMIGTDPNGRRLRNLLTEKEIDASAIVECDDFHTTIKTRIIAGHQQLVRLDREKFTVPGPSQIRSLVTTVRKKMPEIDALIFEDYGKGFLAAELVSEIASDALAAGKIVAADPNPRNSIEWHGVTVVKPNRAEAFLAAGIPLRDPEVSPEKDVDLIRAGEALLKKWGTKYILITLGEHGMMLFQKSESPHHIPTKAQEVFDVSGAGDTAIALFTLALACEATPVEAAEIANHGSAVVVEKVGTATVTRDELAASFQEDWKRG